MRSSFLNATAAVLVLLACAGLLVFCYTRVEAKRSAVAALAEEIAEETATVNRVNSARTTLAELADDEAQIKDYFVSADGVVAFIDALQAQGAAQGAAVSVLSVGAAGDSKTHAALALSVSVQGTFDAVVRTLGAIEYAPYDLTVSQLSLTQGSAGTGTSWTGTLNLTVGSEGAASASAAAPAAPGGAAPSAPASGGSSADPRPVQ